MTLGDMIEELELLAKRYALDTPVDIAEYGRTGLVDYMHVQSVEYSLANDSIVVW